VVLLVGGAGAAEAPRGSGRVEGHVAAAHDQHAVADLEGSPQVHVQQEIDRGEHTRRVRARDAQRAPLAAARRQEHGVVVAAQVGKRDRAADLDAQAQLDAQPT
jgi:hypothetical protein